MHRAADGRIPEVHELRKLDRTLRGRWQDARERRAHRRAIVRIPEVHELRKLDGTLLVRWQDARERRAHRRAIVRSTCGPLLRRRTAEPVLPLRSRAALSVHRWYGEVDRHRRREHWNRGQWRRVDHRARSIVKERSVAWGELDDDQCVGVLAYAWFKQRRDERRFYRQPRWKIAAAALQRKELAERTAAEPTAAEPTAAEPTAAEPTAADRAEARAQVAEALRDEESFRAAAAYDLREHAGNPFWDEVEVEVEDLANRLYGEADVGTLTKEEVFPLYQIAWRTRRAARRPPRSAEEEREVLALARASYEEVRQASANIEEKVYRFFTGIAFITTGALAIGLREDVTTITFDMDGRPLQLPLLLFASFLLFVLVGTFLLLVCLLPSAGRPSPSHRGRSRSHLFWLNIAGQSDDEWTALWAVEPRKIVPRLVEDYATETRDIAIRTDYQYSRVNEARSAFTLALVALASGAGLAVTAAADDGTFAGSSLGWTAAPRAVIAGVVVLFGSLTVYDHYRADQNLTDRYSPRTAGRAWARRRRIAYLPIALAAFATALSLDEVHRSHGLVLVAVAAVVALYATQGRWNFDDSKPWFRSLAVLAVSALAAAAVVRGSEAGRLAVLLGVVPVLEMPRLLRATYLWGKRRVRRD